MEKRYRHIETPSEFGFGYLESVLAMPVVVASENRTAFAHRVKNLLKLADKVGLKLGVGHGAGKATMYGWEDAGILGVAIELTQLGMPPERAMKLIKNNEDKVLVALATACEAFVISPEKYAHRGPRDKAPMQILVWTDPRVLTTAMANPEADPDLFEEYLDFGTPDHFMSQLKEMDYAMPRFVVANLTSLISLMSMVSMVKHTAEMAEKMHYAIVTILQERGDKHHVKHLKVNSRGFQEAKPTVFNFDAWIASLTKSPPARPRFWNRRAHAALLELIDHSTPYYIIPQAEDAQFDLIVRLPDNNKLVVDAKVSSLDNDIVRAIRQRVEKIVESPFRQSDPYASVLLYLASDALVVKAINDDPKLVEWLIENRIVLVDPSSMMAVLKSIEAIWAEAKKSEEGSAEFNELVSDHDGNSQA